MPRRQSTRITGALAIAVSLSAAAGCVTSAPPNQAAGPTAGGLEGVPVEPYGVRDCVPAGHLMLRVRPAPGWRPA
jgi:hypothetical protein